MNNLFFLAVYFIFFFQNLIILKCDNDITCSTKYLDCFNCSTCGEEVTYFEECPCKWNLVSCENVDNKISITEAYQAFDTCRDDNSKLIQNKFCGSTEIDIGDKYEFSLPLIDEKYGTRSIYCEYTLKVLESDDVYYNINYNFDTKYLSEFNAVHLFFMIKYSDSTSIYSNLPNPSLNKDFHTVNQIIFRVYLEKGYSVLPFSFIVTKINDNSKLALYITIGIILLACIICAVLIYFLSKKISKNARLRQQALFAMAMAHQRGQVEAEEEDEETKQQRIENENKLKIDFALKNYLKPKKFLKKYGTKDGNTCTICIDDFKEKKSRVSVTPCNHVFHYKCLSNWLSKNVINPKCPNCNYNLIQDVKDSDINKPEVINPERIEVIKGPNTISVVDIATNSDNNRINDNQENRENPASRNNFVGQTNNTENQNIVNTQNGNIRNTRNNNQN